MKQPKIQNGRIVMYHHDGSELHLPTSAAWHVYLRKGYSLERQAPPKPPAPPPLSPVEQLRRAGIFEGMWQGRRVYIVGGGPSLNRLDLSSLEGHITIAVNRAHERLSRPSLHVTLDYRFVEGVLGGSYGTPAREKYLALTCPRLVVQTAGKRPPEGVLELPRGSDDGWSTSLERGVCTGNNSGYVALQLATLLGARSIYLLGFDMRPGHANGSGHPWPTDPAVYDLFRARFEQAAPQIEAHVVNLCPGSGLGCFPTAPAKIGRSHWPTFVSYHTPDPLYRQHAARLQRSLDLYGLPCRNLELSGEGTWTACAARKVGVLRQAVEAVGPCVWIDADATIEANPAWLLDPPKCDLAVHRRPNGELLSGTVYVAATQRAKRLLAEWQLACEREPREWDQKLLARLIDRKAVKGLRVEQLPAEYVAVPDIMGDELQERPVILHHQASREVRRNGLKPV